ncbi:ferrous iron transport protein B [Ectobacillus ponti]|uniref:Ferrous iron transport protein B n=1 Tax=Ectobacillus ponti TaxID=2961894 RepID=A0AA42BRE2_9BACI|nr:ferrous iron transport protein B [Ectobacillus ponti]MCP8970316.1 ferrous iron transport protein B [Ectobacillus ponti]
MQHIGLFGNPNTGKTSLFNALTGSYEYVGNWSGVTVEKKVGTLKQNRGVLIDLPGVYSLHPLSRDERVATDFLLHESFSAILNIVDASQLERNLHLTIQLLEFGKPVLIGLNMVDVAAARGANMDTAKLGRALGVPVHSIVARKGTGCEALLQELSSIPDGEPLMIYYGEPIERAVHEIVQLLPDTLPGTKRWHALQYLEGNEPVMEEVAGCIGRETAERIASAALEAVQAQGSAKTMKQHIYKKRTQFIQGVTKEAVTRSREEAASLTERIDRVATHKVFGIPIFLLMMFLLFKVTFDWLGTPISDQLDGFMAGTLTDWAKLLLHKGGASPFIEAVVLNGIIAGVGGVLVFVPQIFILFFFISLLEDSGYMARVATVMDRLMEKIGLNGKAFIPMIIGLGCNVPGVMAARTIEQPKERLLTILLTPLMSCSARLSVYSLFVAAFFPKHQALVVLSLYVLGIVSALVLAKVFSSTLLKNESTYFLIELPPYRVPQWKSLLRSTWDKGKGFVKKAGTFIFGGSVIIWLLSYAGPGGLNVDMDHSYLAMIGGVLAPLFAPIGFATWQAGAALITGFLAKEVVVSTMTIIYKTPDIAALQASMNEFFTPLSAYSFLVFVLLYIPCLATVAVIQKETNSKKWTAFSMGYALVLAYGLSLIVYEGGKLLGFQ